MKRNYFRNIILGTLFIGPCFVHGSINAWKAAESKSEFLKTNLESVGVPAESMDFIARLLGKKEIEQAFKPDFETVVQFSSTITYGTFVNGLQNLTQELANKFNLENKSYEELYNMHAQENKRLNALLKTDTNERLIKINDLETEKTELEKNLNTTQEKLEKSTQLLDAIEEKRQQLSTDMSHARDQLEQAKRDKNTAEKTSSMAKSLSS